MNSRSKNGLVSTMSPVDALLLSSYSVFILLLNAARSAAQVAAVADTAAHETAVSLLQLLLLLEVLQIAAATLTALHAVGG